MQLQPMRIITESGSTYTINERGICTKHDSSGRGVDAFKVYITKAIPDSTSSMPEIHALPESAPEVGKRLYVGSKDGWWLSTLVVSIEKLPK
jgi:hypothetical protein